VVATGSDGYRVVYSNGELNPNFGNKPAIIAINETVGGTSAPLGADGFARTTAPGDVRGGRYVSNLASLNVVQAPSNPSQGGGKSTSFTVCQVAQNAIFNASSLAALPQNTLTVGSDVYTGVYLWDLINSLGIITDPSVKNDILSLYVLATGSDGYEVAFSMGELNPLFGNMSDLVALTLNGQPIDQNGFARIIAPNDVKARTLGQQSRQPGGSGCRLSRRGRSGALHLGNDDPWLCRRWLHDVSPAKDSRARGLIDPEREYGDRLRAVFLLAA